jgi:curved DNA-binding protein CbpA
MGNEMSNNQVNQLYNFQRGTPQVQKPTINTTTPRQTTNTTEIDLSNVNPYKVLDLSKNFTLDQLKQNYKKLALIFHPDRPRGSHNHFQVITHCYNILLEELKLRQEDKQYVELKNNSEDFIAQQKKNNIRNVNLSNSRFNIETFNKLYSDNKIDTPYDMGYDEWFKSDRIEEDSNNNNKVVEYNVPDTAYKQDNCVELGIDKFKDFSGENYCDLKKAYNNNKIVDETITFKEYKNLDELQEERSNITPLNNKEIAVLEHIKMNEKIMEENRKEIQSKYDNKYEEQYNKLNKRMLDKVYNH